MLRKLTGLGLFITMSAGMSIAIEGQQDNQAQLNHEASATYANTSGIYGEKGLRCGASEAMAEYYKVWRIYNND